MHRPCASLAERRAFPNRLQKATRGGRKPRRMLTFSLNFIKNNFCEIGENGVTKGSNFSVRGFAVMTFFETDDRRTFLPVGCAYLEERQCELQSSVSPSHHARVQRAGSFDFANASLSAGGGRLAGRVRRARESWPASSSPWSQVSAAPRRGCNTYRPVEARRSGYGRARDPSRRAPLKARSHI